MACVRHVLQNGSHVLKNGMSNALAGLDYLARHAIEGQPKVIAIIARNLTELREAATSFYQALEAANVSTRMERGWCWLDELLRDAISCFDGSVRQSNVEIERSLEKMEAHVYVELTRMCFLRLIDNAIRAIPNGGRLRVVLRLCETAEWEAAFEYDGSGIGAVDLERLHRGDYPLESEHRLGIVLGLTRMYCQAHGGVLHVESVPGRGTAVVMRIPLTEPGIGSARLSAAREPPE
jgi:signal transduction histidine kinase